MSNLYILGLGPGHKDYILDITRKHILESDIIIGGRRNIESIAGLTEGKDIYYIDRHLDKMLDFIRANYHKKIAVVVSGDTGFYSLLPYFKSHFDREYRVIPGISSIQYLFGRICETWQDAFISSVHGRELDLAHIAGKHPKIGLLTDSKYTPQNIAKILYDNNIRDIKITVGERLSYIDEEIKSYEVEELMKEKRVFDINVVIIRKELTSGI